MKLIFAFIMFCGVSAGATEAIVYEADCGMQTYPSSPNEAPITIAKKHVRIPSGTGITIYKKGNLTYSADFYGDMVGPKPLYMITISLIDTTHGRKVTQANIASHDLNALEQLIAGLYVPGPNPTAACGTQM